MSSEPGAPSAGCSSRGPRPRACCSAPPPGGSHHSLGPAAAPSDLPFHSGRPEHLSLPLHAPTHFTTHPLVQLPPHACERLASSCPGSVTEVGSVCPTATDVKRGKCRWGLQFRLQQANLCAVPGRLYIAKWPLAEQGAPTPEGLVPKNPAGGGFLLGAGQGRPGCGLLLFPTTWTEEDAEMMPPMDEQ